MKDGNQYQMLQIENWQDYVNEPRDVDKNTQFNSCLLVQSLRPSTICPIKSTLDTSENWDPVSSMLSCRREAYLF